MEDPSRGEIWLVSLNPVRGNEQAGYRPGLVISVDEFNHGPAGLVIIVPITSKEKGIVFHVEIKPAESGLSKRSFVKCEDIRSIAKERLDRCLGKVSVKTLREVDDRIKILLGLF